MTKETENRFLILYAVLKQNGKANKMQVLNYLEDNDLIILSQADKQILQSRKEEKWRNELAFVRQHLVKEGFLNNKERNFWEVTEAGKDYFNQFKHELKNKTYYRVKSEILIDETFIQEQLLESGFAKELFEDNQELKNETLDRQIQLIKRYQSIISIIKDKYNSRCQLKDCQYTFQKINGEFYSEGHHLLPLSQGGNQDENNVVILCANHHRMFHYAKIKIFERVDNSRLIELNGEQKIIEYK